MSVPVSRQILEKIADKLSRKIPAPFKPPAKAAKSWRTLRIGQILRTKIAVFRPAKIRGEQTMNLPVGTLLTIEHLNSQGLRLVTEPLSPPYKGALAYTGVLAVRQPLTSDPEEGKVFTIHWSNPNWQRMFDKVQKKRKTK